MKFELPNLGLKDCNHMKSALKLKFVDCSPGYVPEEERIYKILSCKYDIDTAGSPDYIISCGLGYEHLRYPETVKILWAGENIVPDFNWFDYAIGFDHLEFGDRYVRVPLYFFYMDDLRRVQNRTLKDDAYYLNRGFCSFVVTNGGGDPMRTKFLECLSRYKPVASGGRYMNNVGGPIRDKFAFCQKYKFNIAFENSSSPGYVTEKILQAYAAEAIPIYYGDPNVETDFPPASMIRVLDDGDIERAVSEIIYLDQNDDAYIRMVKQSCLVNQADVYEHKLVDFFDQIFKQDKNRARRRNRYGYQPKQVARDAQLINLRERIISCAVTCKRHVFGWLPGGHR